MNDQVSRGELMGRNEYARHQGVSPNAVAKAVRSGRIAKAVVWGPRGQVKAIKWRLADELWRSNTDINQALRTRRSYPAGWGGAPAVEISAGQPQRPSSPSAAASDATSITPRGKWPITQELMAQILGAIFADSVVAWGAMAVARYRVEPRIAIEMILDALLVMGVSAAEQLGADTDEFPVYLDGAMEEASDPQRRLVVAEKIRALARLIDLQRPTVIGKIRELALQIEKDDEEYLKNDTAAG